MKESDLKRKAVSFLKRNYPGIWFYCPTDKFYSGIPDIFGIHEGIPFSIELKTPKGRVSKIQEHTLRKISEAGGVCGVCRSVEDVAVVMNEIFVNKFCISKNPSVLMTDVIEGG